MRQMRQRQMSQTGHSGRWFGALAVALLLLAPLANAQGDDLSLDLEPDYEPELEVEEEVAEDTRDLGAGTQDPVSEPNASTETEDDAAAVGAAAAVDPSIVEEPSEPQRPVKEPGVIVADLARCVALAEVNYPKIRQAQARLRQADAQVFEAHSAPYSQWTTKASLGIGPTVEGTSIYSPNTALEFNKPALVWRIGFEGLLPVWTFGKITAAWDAADAQVDLRKFEILKERNDVRFAVYRAYYGLLLARDARLLVDDARSRIGKYVTSLEQKVEDDEADETQLFKIKLQLVDLDARDSEARHQEEIALGTLRFLTGVPMIDAPDEPVERAPHELAPLSRYVNAAKISRPEINMARAGSRAATAQVDLMEAEFYPDVGLVLSAEWAEAPEVTDQLNPFVSDAGNFVQYGFAFVMRWNMDFVPSAARYERAKAQRDEVHALRDFAMGGVQTEVQKAYSEAAHAARRLALYQRAVSVAKAWVVQVQQGIDIGVTEEKDITAPAKEYAFKRFDRLRAIHDYNIALAKLSQVTGWEEIDPFR
jgi:outer membrane protein TolC